jgi:hypothetical protein
MQLAYNGQALYTFVSDKALTATGDGVQDFHLAHPLATTAPQPQPQPTQPPSPTY